MCIRDRGEGGRGKERREGDRDRDRETERDRDKDRETEGDRDKDRQRDRDRERQTDRDRERQRQRDRETLLTLVGMKYGNGEATRGISTDIHSVLDSQKLFRHGRGLMVLAGVRCKIHPTDNQSSGTV